MILRKAKPSELQTIWEIIQYAIAQRKADGSDQWQNGYPNEQTIQEDLDAGYAYVLDEDGVVLVYAAIIFGKEDAYDDIDGKWLTRGDYAVLHRVAASPLAKGKRAATRLFQLTEKLCTDNNIYSIKVDTNFDNPAMLRLMDNLGYTFCGEVFFQNAPRKAFEKVLAHGESL
jgi:GNAT superfamily N-acetyltransferase